MSPDEALQQALAEVYSGAGELEAGCLADQLHDLGFEVTPMPRRRLPRVPDPTPIASTRGLPKKAHA